MVRARFRVEGPVSVFTRRRETLRPSADVGYGEMVGRGRSKRPSRTRRVRVGGDVRLSVGWAQTPALPSGRKWNRSQPCQGAAELGFPGPAVGKVQGEAAGRAGEPSRQGEEPPPEGLGGDPLLAQTDARRPPGQVVGHHLYRQPGGIGGEAPGGEMVQADAILEVADGILDLGVAAMISLQFQGLPVPVGDEAMVAVAGEEGQLGTGRGLHPPNDEPHRGGVGLTLEGV